MNDTMIVAVLREVEEKKARKKRYVIEWRLLLPKRVFYICALRRHWTDDEIKILLKHQHNLKKAAKILDRSYGAVRVKWSELQKELGLRKTDKVVAYPERDLALRREVVEKLLSWAIELRGLLSDGWKEDLTNSDLWKMLTPREKIRLTRVVLELFDRAERWQTSKEHLEIYKDEKEHADQAGEG